MQQHISVTDCLSTHSSSAAYGHKVSFFNSQVSWDVEAHKRQAFSFISETRFAKSLKISYIEVCVNTGNLLGNGWGVLDIHLHTKAKVWSGTKGQFPLCVVCSSVKTHRYQCRYYKWSLNRAEDDHFQYLSDTTEMLKQDKAIATQGDRFNCNFLSAPPYLHSLLLISSTEEYVQRCHITWCS